MARKAKSRPLRQRCEYRATLAGVLFLLGLLMITAAAVNTQRSLLFGILGIMLGAFFLSVFVSRWIVSSVEVRRDMPQRAFANRVVHLAYQLHHRPGRGPALGLELTEIDSPPPLQSLGAFCLYLPAGGSFKSGSRFAVRRRGRYRLAGLRLSTRFPFSLISARRDVQQKGSLVVWPALGTLRSDLLGHGAAEVSDAAPSRFRSGADEFFGLREYRQGDNPRWIHWRRTAAAGTPVVREMSKPRPDVLFVVLDTQLSDGSAEAFARRERLIRFAATLIEHAFHREYRVGLAAAYADRVLALPAAAGRGRRSQVLDALAELDENTHRSLADTLAALPRRLLWEAHVVAVAPEPARLTGLEDLRAACRRLTTVTADDLEAVFEDDPHSQARQEVP
ncbi:MAG: hypothetical protein AMJ81_14460 [Phycisphaerae bacterium SM23_33]|nr:MAG: hypothetical protein AMJ81_14460 [Phycisphaerae bacterium SM23_33]